MNPLSTSEITGIPVGSWHLLGVELWGPPPLGYVRLPFIADRISVLFGLNGAGKSTVLTSLRAAFRGRLDDAPLLEWFRFHLELRDPSADDELLRDLEDELRSQLAELGGESPDRARPIEILARDVLRARFDLVAKDPCCTDELRAGLAFPDGTPPLRITVTSDGSGGSELALALRGDDTAPRLLRNLLEERMRVVPGDEVVDGTPSGLVWRALRKSAPIPTDHRCTLHIGEDNADGLVDGDSDEAGTHPRAFVTRWASDWLFNGELVEIADRNPPLPRWFSIPVHRVGRVQTTALLPRIAAEDADLEASAERAVRTVMHLTLAGEPPHPGLESQFLWDLGFDDPMSADEAKVEDDVRQWTMEQHERETLPSIIEDTLNGLYLELFARPAPGGRRIGPSGRPLGESRTLVIPDLPPTRFRSALAAVNVALLDWVAQVVVGFSEPRIEDRFSRFRTHEFRRSLEAGDLVVRLDGLSTAQERWVRIALAVFGARDWVARPTAGAAAPAATPHLLLIIDEPEQSLHRDAERGAIRRLEQLVRHENATAIIATHSPLMLDSELAVLHQVRMTAEGIDVASDDGTFVGLSERAGARPSDLAVLQRAFLLVEGEVDRIVIEAMFGPELQRLRVAILPFGGSDGLHAAVAAFQMLALTDADAVVLLDHIDHDRMQQVLERTADVVAKGGPNRAVIDLAKQQFDRHAEDVAAKLIKEAVKRDQLSRIHIAGLAAIDILELIPPNLLGCRATSADLEAAKVEQQGRRWTSQRTKEWLRSNGADLSHANIRAAVERMDHVPPDLLRMMETVEAAAQR